MESGRSTIVTKIQTTADGAILFDAGSQAQARFDPTWFEPGQRELRAGGRGGVGFVEAPFGSVVVRHYRRGGMVAAVLGDRYLWTGAERTRAFTEFRLLAELRRRGLNVPEPVAARFRRSGFYYHADLITRQIENAQTLAQTFDGARADAEVAAKVGSTIAGFHAAGAYHADLNAHNILLADNRVWLIDFDRGQLREPAREWQMQNLSRLHRSLIKIGAAAASETTFENSFWTPLTQAYERTLGGSAGSGMRGASA